MKIIDRIMKIIDRIRYRFGRYDYVTDLGRSARYAEIEMEEYADEGCCVPCVSSGRGPVPSEQFIRAVEGPIPVCDGCFCRYALPTRAALVNSLDVARLSEDSQP